MFFGYYCSDVVPGVPGTDAKKSDVFNGSAVAYFSYNTCKSTPNCYSTPYPDACPFDSKDNGWFTSKVGHGWFTSKGHTAAGYNKVGQVCLFDSKDIAAGYHEQGRPSLTQLRGVEGIHLHCLEQEEVWGDSSGGGGGFSPPVLVHCTT